MMQVIPSDSFVSLVNLAKPIFYSFEAVLIRFTLLEFAKIEKCSATFAV
jgi:hypothetical protein